ncbi:MAG: hypothetical protein M3Q19_04320 [Pseudomonadota bacterium]|nr:hypothetical protein [Pseudomonadota bacterium]
MSHRSLFAMLIAFAMLFAPLALQSGAAMAMAPADHHAQMMESGHCGEQPAKSQDGKTMDKSCCAAMCAAVAVAPSVKAEPHVLTPSAQRPALDQFQHSFIAELPTPPPRLA